MEKITKFLKRIVGIKEPEVKTAVSTNFNYKTVQAVYIPGKGTLLVSDPNETGEEEILDFLPSPEPIQIQEISDKEM